MLERLVYRSVAAPGLGLGEVEKIVERSEENNRERSITGFLIFDGGRFLQVLEGSPGDIDLMMRVIEKDPRHGRVEVLERAVVTERWFPSWDMKHLLTFQGVPALEAVRAQVKGKASGRELVALTEEFVGAN